MTSLDAYRLYSEARSAYAASTRTYAEARDKLRAAVTLDVKYAQAWALLGKLDARMAAPATFSGGSLSELRAETTEHNTGYRGVMDRLVETCRDRRAA